MGCCFGSLRRVLFSKSNLRILGIYAMASLLSVFTGYAALLGAKRGSELIYTAVTSSSEYYALTLLVVVVVGSLILVVLLRLKMLRLILNYYVALIVFISFYGLVSTWGGWAHYVLSGSTSPPVYVAALSLMVGALCLAAYLKNRFAAFNLWGVAISVYLSAYLAYLLQPFVLIGFLVALSVYDYVAVNKTKHMVALANLAVGDEEPLPLMVVSHGPRRAVGGLGGSGEAQALGLGDIALPSALTTSLFVTSSSPIWIYAFVGALFGVFADTWLLYRLRRPLPALPAITASMMVFIAVGVALTLRL